MHIAAANPPEADPQAVMNQAYTQDPNKTVADYLNEVIAQTGENITIKRFVRFVPQGAAEAYIHMGGKIGVLVEFECNPDLGKTDAFKEFAKNIAMHIAATSPLGIVPEDVPQEVVDKEKEIYRAQALQTGKPEKMLDKIAEGKLGKFFKDVCLMNQAYVKDPNKTVANYLKEVVSQAGGDITIKRFARFQLGE
jgi:elongation factor Ts